MNNSINVGNVTVTNPNSDKIMLTIPAGMTGRALIRFKLANKAALKALGVSIPNPQTVMFEDFPESDDTAEGDRRPRARG